MPRAVNRKEKPIEETKKTEVPESTPVDTSLPKWYNKTNNSYNYFITLRATPNYYKTLKPVFLEKATITTLPYGIGDIICFFKKNDGYRCGIISGFKDYLSIISFNEMPLREKLFFLDTLKKSINFESVDKASLIQRRRFIISGLNRYGKKRIEFFTRKYLFPGKIVNEKKQISEPRRIEFDDLGIALFASNLKGI